MPWTGPGHGGQYKQTGGWRSKLWGLQHVEIKKTQRSQRRRLGKELTLMQSEKQERSHLSSPSVGGEFKKDEPQKLAMSRVRRTLRCAACGKVMAIGASTGTVSVGL